MKKSIILLSCLFMLHVSVKAQWNPNTDQNLLISNPSVPNYEMPVSTNSNGVTYEVMEIPNSGNVETHLQIIDRDGNKMFPTEGKLVSNENTLTWIVVGDRVFTDSDGNVIIAVNDQRTGAFSYTLYKYNEKGEELWGNVQMNDGNALKCAYGIRICQTSDGGYVVSYLANDKASFDTETSYVLVEKITNDGKKAWDAPLRIGGKEGDDKYSHPYVVDAGDNQCILVYAKGINQDLMARLLDFDGSSAWDDDVVVYNGGGWGTIPLHAMMKVHKGPDNGVLVTWWDGRNNINYQNCISYITNDGTYGFSTGSEGTLVSNDDRFSRNVPDVYYDDEERCIYCVFSQFLQNDQGTCGIYMQKISYDGELLWGPEGKPVVQMQKKNGYGYPSIRRTGDGNLAIFYQEHVGHVSNAKVNTLLRIYDKDGNVLTEPVNFTTNDNEKSSLHVSQIIDNKYFLIDWLENRKELNGGKEGIQYNKFMHYVDYSGIITGIDEIPSEESVSSEKVVSEEIFSVAGKHLTSLEKGINLVRTTYADGTVKTNKVIK